MAYTTIDNPELYFQVKIYTGNGGTQSITFDGSEDMQPDFLWVKGRSVAEGHYIQDSVRGVTKHLHTQNTDAEVTDTGVVTALNSDGFSLGDEGDVNSDGGTFVAWAWKAGTSFSNDASATSVGTIDSTGSINTTAGISIISYTGTGSAGTIAHGLDSTPQMIILKNRTDDSSSFWGVYHHSSFVNASDPNVLYLNSTGAASDDTNVFGTSTTFSSTVFSVGDYNGSNGSSDNIIAYCFAEKQGFSKFGSFEGNGNAAGPFVYCGFRPAFVMIKDFDNSGNSWLISDNKRNTFNVADDRLFADLNNAENQPSDSGGIDFVSNGFKVRTNDGSTNASGTRIFMAFAEQPFVNSNGVPCNAR